MPATELHRMRHDRIEQARARLMTSLARRAPAPGKFPTAMEGLHITRWNDDGQKDVCFYAPAIGVIIQGEKESVIGSATFRYGALDCVVNGVHMPSDSTVLAATPEKPLLALSLAIDRKLVTELAAEIPAHTGGVHAPVVHANCLGISIARVTPDVLDAFGRLVETLDRPTQRTLLGPLLCREIITRVLMGPQGNALRMIHSPGAHCLQVAQAIHWLRENYAQPLRIDDLAQRVGMATSTFHRQFKNVTSLSPLQFQKYVRLYEAQRLMLAENKDAGHAGRAVGYDSVQQFSREYRRMFGQPPRRNIQKLRRE